MNKSKTKKIKTIDEDIDLSDVEVTKVKKSKKHKEEKLDSNVEVVEIKSKKPKINSDKKKKKSIDEEVPEDEENDSKPVKTERNKKKKTKDVDSDQEEEPVSKKTKSKIIKTNIDEDLLGSDDDDDDLEEDEHKIAVDDDLPHDNLRADNDEDEDTKMVDVAHMNVDMNELNLKIQNIVEVLTNFKERKQENKSRGDYMAEFKKLIMIYYDYNSDLTDLIMNLFPPNEVDIQITNKINIIFIYLLNILINFIGCRILRSKQHSSCTYN